MSQLNDAAPLVPGLRGPGPSASDLALIAAAAGHATDAQTAAAQSKAASTNGLLLARADLAASGLSTGNLYRAADIIDGQWVDQASGAVVANGSGGGLVRIPVVPGRSYHTNIPTFGDGAPRWVYLDVAGGLVGATFVQPADGSAFAVPATAVTLLVSVPSNANFVRSTGYIGEAAVPATVQPRPDVAGIADGRLAAAGVIAAPGANLAAYTETLAHAPYGGEGVDIDGGSTMRVRTERGVPITLTKCTSHNFYSFMRANLNGYGIPTFISGRTYIVSYYILGQCSRLEEFFWMRSQGDGGHGYDAKMMTAGLRRVWTYGVATSATKLSFITDPKVAPSQGAAGEDPTLFFQGGYMLAGLTFWAGGVQIEEAPADRYGIAVIGESTIQFDDTFNDQQAATGPLQWLRGALNVAVFNRAVGGQQVSTMDARWDQDMTPLAVNAKYAIIEGAINSCQAFGDGGSNPATLADIQAPVLSMVNKAIRDNMIPVVTTCTPLSVGAAAAKEQARQQYNTWVRATFPRVLDIDTVIADPANPANILPIFAPPDGSPHYLVEGRRREGLYIARAPFWDFARPAPYQPRLAA